VIEQNDTLGSLQGLYNDPQGNPAFMYLGEVAGAQLYRVELVP